jgi:hypothetical protein
LNAQGETINVTVVSVRVSKEDAEPAPLTVDKIELSLP